jgi:hypothetical protein
VYERHRPPRAHPSGLGHRAPLLREVPDVRGAVGHRVADEVGPAGDRGHPGHQALLGRVGRARRRVSARRQGASIWRHSSAGLETRPRCTSAENPALRAPRIPSRRVRAPVDRPQSARLQSRCTTEPFRRRRAKGYFPFSLVGWPIAAFDFCEFFSITLSSCISGIKASSANTVAILFRDSRSLPAVVTRSRTAEA